MPRSGVDMRAPWLPLLLLALGSCAAPGERALTLYGGQYVNNSLPEEILLFRPLDPQDSHMVALAFAQTFHRVEGEHRWELEQQLVKHFGDQDHWEVNALVIFRWLRFPWARPRTTLAIGDGLSLASEEPRLELQFEEESSHLLNYVLLEATVALPREGWSLVGRVHHRSGIFGLFGGVESGSNLLTVGLRYEF